MREYIRRNSKNHERRRRSSASEWYRKKMRVVMAAIAFFVITSFVLGYYVMNMDNPSTTPTQTQPTNAIIGKDDISEKIKQNDQELFSKKSITIMQTDNRPISSLLNGSEYISFTVINNYLYAMKHEYNFIYYHWNTPNHSKSHENMHSKTKYQHICGGRAAPWCKILSLRDAVSNSKPNDCTLMIDSDVVFRDYNRSLEDYLNQIEIGAKNATIFAHGSGATGDGKNHMDGTCTGLILAKSTQKTKEIIEFWRNSVGKNCTDYYFRHPFEQMYWNTKVTPTFPNDISYMMDDSFDWPDHDFFRHVHWMHKLQKRVKHFNATLLRTIKFKEMEDGEAVNISEIVQIIKTKHTIQMYDKPINHKHQGKFNLIQ